MITATIITATMIIMGTNNNCGGNIMYGVYLCLRAIMRRVTNKQHISITISPVHYAVQYISFATLPENSTTFKFHILRKQSFAAVATYALR